MIRRSLKEPAYQLELLVSARGGLAETAVDTSLGYTDQFGQSHHTYSPPVSAETAATHEPIPIVKNRSQFFE